MHRQQIEFFFKWVFPSVLIILCMLLWLHLLYSPLSVCLQLVSFLNLNQIFFGKLFAFPQVYSCDLSQCQGYCTMKSMGTLYIDGLWLETFRTHSLFHQIGVWELVHMGRDTLASVTVLVGCTVAGSDSFRLSRLSFIFLFSSAEYF